MIVPKNLYNDKLTKLIIKLTDNSKKIVLQYSFRINLSIPTLDTIRTEIMNHYNENVYESLMVNLLLVQKFFLIVVTDVCCAILISCHSIFLYLTIK